MGISVESAGGTSTMLESIAGGLRVAKPPAATAVSDDSTVITPTTELMLLDCDDYDSARNEIFSPSLAAGVDGQVVRMVNVGEDVCVLNGPEPLTDTSNNNFRLLADNQAQNQAFLPSSSTPLTMMYYHTPADITCSSLVDADRTANPHTHQTTCAGGGWYQVVDAPATYCTDTCAADGVRWCQHEATHAAPSVSGVAAADINGDSREDIVSVSSAGSVTWFESAAEGGVQWTAHEIDADATGALHVLVLDIDGDGDLDVATLVDSSTAGDVDLVWYANAGSTQDYSFSDPYFIATIGQKDGMSLAMAAGHMDLDDGGDGIVVVSSGDTAIKIFYCGSRAGAGSCDTAGDWSPTTLSVGSGHIDSGDLLDDIVLADVDADGDLDIVTASRSNSIVRWHENNAAFPMRFSRVPSDTPTSGANFFISSSPQTLAGTRLRLGAFDMDGNYGTAASNADNIGLDVVVSSPGNGRMYVLQNIGQNGWSQITMNSNSPGVTAVVVADVDNDNRDDIITAGATSMQYYLTGGGGIHDDPTHPGYDGQTWTAVTATEFTGTCQYDTEATCPSAATWNSATETCENVPATLDCYANSGVNKPGQSQDRGWAAPTMIAAANVVGADARLDIVFASDSSSVHTGAGYVGVYESISGTC